jgi:osmoprotectant transport system permease protein
MYAGIAQGDVDVISAYSTDGRIASQGLVVLEDSRKALPPYDAVLLLSMHAASNSELLDNLKPIIGRINDNIMRNANKIVDVDGGSVESAARYLLREIGLPDVRS